jgi:hypothetical protein
MWIASEATDRHQDRAAAADFGLEIRAARICQKTSSSLATQWKLGLP